MLNIVSKEAKQRRDADAEEFEVARVEARGVEKEIGIGWRENISEPSHTEQSTKLTLSV